MMSKWQVTYYIAPNGEIPVKTFLDSVRPVQKTKALRILFHIREYGLEVAIPHIKKLAGTPIWEIRILGREGVRILYVMQKEREIVLLHGFLKKTQQTPVREISIAEHRYQELTRR